MRIICVFVIGCCHHAVMAGCRFVLLQRGHDQLPPLCRQLRHLFHHRCLLVKERRLILSMILFLLSFSTLHFSLAMVARKYCSCSFDVFKWDCHQIVRECGASFPSQMRRKSKVQTAGVPQYFMVTRNIAKEKFRHGRCQKLWREAKNPNVLVRA